MSDPRILVSPKGYDDVNSVLQRIGGSFANAYQLLDPDIAHLGDKTFLTDFEHLFLNCHAGFQPGRNNWIRLGKRRPTFGSVIRDFVLGGGTLYASDWASAVVESVSEGTVTFSEGVGEAGVVQARVSDPYLTQRLGRTIPINFDMPGWILVDRFPASADVYLWDDKLRPLAIGFRVGDGRIVFTSFHYHAQQPGVSGVADFLLDWLVTLPTQHKHLLDIGTRLVQYRAPACAQVISRIRDEPQSIPLSLGSKSGLGVFALSWDYDEGVEFRMRYLRNREVTVTEQTSSEPPLVMTVRDPHDEDAIEVSRRVSDDFRDKRQGLHSYVMAESIRRDLIGDRDWFAAALTRHMRASIEGTSDELEIREKLAPARLHEAIDVILSGLGYKVRRHSSKGPKGWTQTWAWSQDSREDAPAIQLEVGVDPTIQSPNKEGFDAIRQFQPPMFYPINGDLIPSAERLLVYVAPSQAGAVDALAPRRNGTFLRSSSDAVTWRAVASESILPGKGKDSISAREFSELHPISFTIYRAEEGTVTIRDEASTW